MNKPKPKADFMRRKHFNPTWLGLTSLSARGIGGLQKVTYIIWGSCSWPPAHCAGWPVRWEPHRPDPWLQGRLGAGDEVCDLRSSSKHVIAVSLPPLPPRSLLFSLSLLFINVISLLAFPCLLLPYLFLFSFFLSFSSFLFSYLSLCPPPPPSFSSFQKTVNLGQGFWIF